MKSVSEPFLGSWEWMTYNILGRWINLLLSMPKIREKKKYFEKIKNISDRPSLFRNGYVTLNTTLFFLAWRGGVRQIFAEGMLIWWVPKCTVCKFFPWVCKFFPLCILIRNLHFLLVYHIFHTSQITRSTQKWPKKGQKGPKGAKISIGW